MKSKNKTNKQSKRKNGYYNLKTIYEKRNGVFRCESLDSKYPYSENPNLQATAEDKEEAKEAVRLLLDQCYSK